MIRALFILILFCAQARAAFTEFYVNMTGTNVNAGNTTNAAPHLFVSNGDWNSGTGVFTPGVDPSLSNVVVGDWASVYVDGATETVFVGRVTGTNATTITVSTTIKTGTAPSTSATARSIRVGGAWYGPHQNVNTTGFPFGFVNNLLTNTSQDPFRVNIKGDKVYSVTNTMTLNSNGPIRWEGWTNTPGDGGMAIITGETNFPTFCVITNNATGQTFANLWFDNNGTNDPSVSTGLQMVNSIGQNCVFYRCRFSNAYRTGLRIAGAGSLIIECEADRCNESDASANAGFLVTEESTWIRCWSHDSMFGTDSSGFILNGDNTEPITLINCVVENVQADAIQQTGNSMAITLSGCTFVNIGGSGVSLGGVVTSQNIVMIENCNFIDCGAYGVNSTSGVLLTAPRLVNCGFYSNTSGDTLNVNSSYITGSITYSGDPHTDSANGNIMLNSTAGAGASAINAGRGVFLMNTNYSASTVSYPDIGAAQVTNSAAGTTTIISYPVGRR